MILKAISLWQPWASLWAAGIKIHETRDWFTNHRGLLAVHAAKHRDGDGALLYHQLLDHQEYSQRLIEAGLPTDEFIKLPFGAIVGVVHIDNCQRAEDVDTPSDFKLEYLLGNFSNGRFAWRAYKASLMKEPIPWKGKQGFFNVEIPRFYPEVGVTGGALSPIRAGPLVS